MRRGLHRNAGSFALETRLELLGIDDIDLIGENFLPRNPRNRRSSSLTTMTPRIGNLRRNLWWTTTDFSSSSTGAAKMDTDREAADRYEQERKESHERYERERKASRERASEERKDSHERAAEERKDSHERASEERKDAAERHGRERRGE
jgi:hypothetical protein